MLTKDFVNKAFILATGKTTVAEALEQSKKFRVPQIPVCINGVCGLLHNSDLVLFAPDLTLSSAFHLIHKVQISANDHIWKSLRSFRSYEARAMPVVDTGNKFVGIVLLRDVLARVFDVFNVGNDGAILELEVNYNSYSLSELSGIVETADAKITLLSVFPIDDSARVKVVFGIDKDDASEIIQSLERYEYQVNAWYMNKGKIDDILEERYDAFMNFINV